MRAEEQKKFLFVNLDKKKMMEPAKLTLSGGSGLQDIAQVHPKWGNPFQYEVFQLLKGNWKGDRMLLVEDTEESRNKLTSQEGCTFYLNYRETFSRKQREEDDRTIVVSLNQSEVNRMQRNWERLVNHFVLINYDSHLFMTIDRRLLKRENQSMPYFSMARADNESEESWAGCRIGVEPIDTPTFDEGTYFEMFRMLKGQPAYQVAIKDFEQRFGERSWEKFPLKNGKEGKESTL